MSNETSLKKQNYPLLWSFFLFNLLVFLGLFFITHFETIKNDYRAIFTIRNSGIILMPIVLYIINGLISSNQKATLVFWKFKNPLPGSRAFSVHANKDFRVNKEGLQSIYGLLPSEAAEQNKLWYKIYRKNITDISVENSHREFLLGRDLVSITFLYIILAGLPAMIFAFSWFSFYYLIFLLVEYFILVRVARNHGQRFVCNVLAVESAL